MLTVEGVGLNPNDVFYCLFSYSKGYDLLFWAQSRASPVNEITHGLPSNSTAPVMTEGSTVADVSSATPAPTSAPSSAANPPAANTSAPAWNGLQVRYLSCKAPEWRFLARAAAVSLHYVASHRDQGHLVSGIQNGSISAAEMTPSVASMA